MRLTVGDLRRAMEPLTDDAQVFVNLGPTADVGIESADVSRQIPWENDDWQEGDPLVFGLELQLEQP